GEPAGGPADLIFALEERCDVDVFAIDRVSRVEGLGPHTRVFSSCHFERLMRREEYAAVVYEIDVDQAWVIPLALEQPGILLLRVATIHDVFRADAGGGCAPQAVLDALGELCGETGRTI